MINWQGKHLHSDLLLSLLQHAGTFGKCFSQQQTKQMCDILSQLESTINKTSKSNFRLHQMGPAKQNQSTIHSLSG